MQRERYTVHRCVWVEHEASSLLSRALPGSAAWERVPWSSAETVSGLDALVSADDLTLRVQCKSGRVTAPARRGAPERMREELGELIADAADQHGALSDALAAQSATGLGFRVSQQRALAAPL